MKRKTRARAGARTGLRTGGDGLLPADTGLPAKKENSLGAGATLTPKTARAAPRASSRGAGTPGLRERRTGAERAADVLIATQSRPLSRATGGGYRIAPGPTAVPAGPPGSAGHGEGHKRRRVRASERSWPQTWSRRGDRLAARF